MTGPESLQFEVVRTVAAGLVSVSIVLLWIVAVSGRQGAPGRGCRPRRRRGGGVESGERPRDVDAPGRRNIRVFHSVRLVGGRDGGRG